MIAELVRQRLADTLFSKRHLFEAVDELSRSGQNWTDWTGAFCHTLGMTTKTIPEYLEDERQKGRDAQQSMEKEAARIQPLNHCHHRTAKQPKLELRSSVKATLAGTPGWALGARSNGRECLAGNKTGGATVLEPTPPA